MPASLKTRPIDKDRVSLKSVKMIAREKWLELKTALKEEIRYLRDSFAPSLEELAIDTLKSLEETARQIVLEEFYKSTGITVEQAWAMCTDAVRYYKMYNEATGEEKAAYKAALKDWLKRQPEVYLKEGEVLVNAMFAIEVMPILDNCRQICMQGRQAALQGARQISDEWKALKQFFKKGKQKFKDDPEMFDRNVAPDAPDSSSAADTGLYSLMKSLATEEGIDTGDAITLNETMSALWDLLEVLLITVMLLGRLAENWKKNHEQARELVSDPITDCGQRKMAADLGITGAVAVTQHLHGVRKPHEVIRIHDSMDDSEWLSGSFRQARSFREEAAASSSVDASVSWNDAGDVYLDDTGIGGTVVKNSPDAGPAPIRPYIQTLDSSWVQTPAPGVPVRDLVGSLPSGAGGVLYDPAAGWAAFSDKSLIPSEVERTKMHLIQAVKDPSLGYNPDYPIINTSTWRDGSRLVNLRFQGDSWRALEDFTDNINGRRRLFNAADYG